MIKYNRKRRIFLNVFLLNILCLLFGAQTALCDFYSVFDRLLDNLKRNTVVKPYFTIGYHASLPILNSGPQCAYAGTSVDCSSYQETDRQHFFSDIADFKNWQIGIGVRLHQYFAIELLYDSYERQIMYKVPPGSANAGELLTSPIALASGQWINLNAVFYTPPLDIKYGTLELSIAPGIALPFLFQNGLDTGGTSSQAYYTYSTPTMNGFTPGFSLTGNIIFGLKQPISLILYAQIVTFAQNYNTTTSGYEPFIYTYQASSQFMVLVGGKVNIYFF